MALTKRPLLLADADATRRTALSELLTLAGYTVHTVLDFAAASAVLAGPDGADLVLVAHPCAGQDGLAFCRTIRDSKATEHLPIIVVADVQAQATLTPQQAMAAGADELIGWPLPTEMFLDLVQQLLHIRDVAEQLDVGVDSLLAALPKGRG